MSDVREKDINRGYVGFIKSVSSISEGKKKRTLGSFLAFFGHLVGIALKLSSIPLLYLYEILLIIWIRCKFLLFAKRPLSPLHQKALHYVPEFISQYPMHLYPVIAKSLEMAFIKENIERITQDLRGEVVELAIGDGTFSRRIFSEKNRVVGFDLNPYSLTQVKKYAHVKQRVVADCLNPPIGPGGASLIVCNNFLHHVTNKEETLKNWASIARYALFNENTNYWAEGWLKPHLLKSIGIRWAAQKAAGQISARSLQILWERPRLGILVRQFYEIQREESFFHEKVFFLSSICSALLFCYGPPTPELQKKVMNGIFAPLTKKITYHLAKTLIEYDSILPRDRDVFICWFLESKQLKQNSARDEIELICPDCRERLQGNQCMRCHRSFDEIEGMLFLLPKELTQEILFKKEKADLLGEEHL